jgi:hypothetical protein
LYLLIAKTAKLYATVLEDLFRAPGQDMLVHVHDTIQGLLLSVPELSLIKRDTHSTVLICFGCPIGRLLKDKHSDSTQQTFCTFGCCCKYLLKYLVSRLGFRANNEFTFFALANCKVQIQQMVENMLHINIKLSCQLYVHP